MTLRLNLAGSLPPTPPHMSLWIEPHLQHKSPFLTKTSTQRPEQGRPPRASPRGSQTPRGSWWCKLRVTFFIWVDGAQITKRLICKWKKFYEKIYPKAFLTILEQACGETLSTSSSFCFPSAWLLTAPGSCHPPTPSLTSFLKPAPWAVFLSHLSSGQLPSFQFLGPKPQSSWILFFFSYPTSNQLVGSPGSSAFKIESGSKPLHFFPATTLLQTTSCLNYCRRRLAGIPTPALLPL